MYRLRKVTLIYPINNAKNGGVSSLFRSFCKREILGYHEGHPPWSRTDNFLLRKLHRGKRLLKTHFIEFRNGQRPK